MKRSVTLVLILISVVILRAQPEGLTHTDYRRPDSVAALYQGHSLSNLPLLTQKLTVGFSTEREKFRALYKWICDNIVYDHAMFDLNKRKQTSARSSDERTKWSVEFRSRVFKNLRTKRQTICTGYAYLLSEMATLAGLKCVIVDGYGRNASSNIGGTGVPNHSWNAVRLDNKWFLCDPTWSAGYYDADQSAFVVRFNPVYFLSEPTSFIKNHFPLDPAWMLLDQKPTLHQFLNGPLFYPAAFNFNITKVYPETFEFTAEKGEDVKIEFLGNKAIRKATILSTHGNSSKEVLSTLTAQNPGKYQVTYHFTTKGTHVMHVLLEDRCVFTYRVLVR